MSGHYTLATCQIRSGQEDSFVAAWDELAATFVSLPNPPIWGTLVRSRSEPGLFISFGPWQSAEHIAAMRSSPETHAAFAKIQQFCTDMKPGDYGLIRQVEARSAREGAEVLPPVPKHG